MFLSLHRLPSLWPALNSRLARKLLLMLFKFALAAATSAWNPGEREQRSVTVGRQEVSHTLGGALVMDSSGGGARAGQYLMSSSVTMKALQRGWAVLSHTPGFFSTAAESCPVMGMVLVCRALAMADRRVSSVQPGPTPTRDRRVVSTRHLRPLSLSLGFHSPISLTGAQALL